MLKSRGFIIHRNLRSNSNAIIHVRFLDSLTKPVFELEYFFFFHCDSWVVGLQSPSQFSSPVPQTIQKLKENIVPIILLITAMELQLARLSSSKLKSFLSTMNYSEPYNLSPLFSPSLWTNVFQIYSSSIDWNLAYPSTIKIYTKNWIKTEGFNLGLGGYPRCPVIEGASGCSPAGSGGGGETAVELV